MGFKCINTWESHSMKIFPLSGTCPRQRPMMMIDALKNGACWFKTILMGLTAWPAAETGRTLAASAKLLWFEFDQNTLSKSLKNIIPLNIHVKIGIHRLLILDNLCFMNADINAWKPPDIVCSAVFLIDLVKAVWFLLSFNNYFLHIV